MKTIDLEKIFERYNYLARVETDSANIDYKGNMLKAMKEACKQTLELAAENATTKTETYCSPFSSDWEKVVSKQSILDTLNQIK